MKTITISTENSETYSSISNFFIDYYMTEANGEFVKVYLYLVRLMSSNQAITVADIADHFNLTENDICRAIKYWISKDVVKLNYDGRGRLNGIVLLPLTPPDALLKPETDAVSILTTSVDEDTQQTVRPKNNVHEFKSIQQAKEETASELTAPPKLKYTSEMIDSYNADQDFEDIVYQIETYFGKTPSVKDTESLIYIYDTLKFNVDLFEYLIEYCTTMNKKSCRYMEAVAIAWYKDGIKTRQQAKEQSSTATEIARIVFKALGIRRAHPTSIEMAYIDTWSKDFGFSNEIIALACDRAVLSKPNSVNFAYINGILENWHKNNVKTISDIQKLDKDFAAKASMNNKNTKNYKGAGNVSSINNFSQTKMDDELDEMENLLLKEVNNK